MSNVSKITHKGVKKLSKSYHITLVENKLSKNLGLLHKANNYLNKKLMVSLYYSFIHTYLNYGNIAWYSTSMTKLKELLS